MDFEILPEIGDYLQLKDNQIIEVIKDGVGENVATKEQCTYTISDVKRIKKFGVVPTHSDFENYWVFECGASFPNTNRFSIVQYAKFELDDYFKDMSLDEIMWKHLFYIDSVAYENSYVLYVQKEKLPQDLYEYAVKNSWDR